MPRGEWKNKDHEYPGYFRAVYVVDGKEEIEIDELQNWSGLTYQIRMEGYPTIHYYGPEEKVRDYALKLYQKRK